MKYCAGCGAELTNGGSCPNCDKTSRTAALIRLSGNQGDWVSSMYRLLLLVFALSTFMFLIRWPVALATDPRSLSADDNFYFLLLTLALFATVGLAVLLRNKAAVVSGFLLAGLGIWVLPGLIMSLFGQNSLARVGFASGALDNLTALLLAPANLAPPLPELLISVGFFLLSFAHLPLAFVGFFAIAQESISNHLRVRATHEPSGRAESPLAIGAFISAFLVPIAGIVLSLIGIVRWSENDGRSRGLLVSALAISALAFLVSVFFVLAVFFGLFGQAIS